MRLEIVLCVVLVISTCNCRSLQEADDSVVSIYTTQPTTANTNTAKPLDVYQQIANNLAERITSPIYRFLGIEHRRNGTEATTKRNWATIELLDEESQEATDKVNLEPVNNNLDAGRDVEELSVEALNKNAKKPEKITLYSSYLPGNKDKLTENSTKNEVDGTFDGEPFEFDETEEEQPQENGFFYFLDLVGGLIQLAWATLVAMFTPKIKG